jgi:outer membrane protein
MKRLTLFVCISVCFAISARTQSLSLEDCVTLALSNNLLLQQSELNVELAEISRLQTLGGMLPNLNAQASHGYNWGQRIDQFTNQFATERIRSNNIGFSTSVSLFNGLSQYNGLQQAEINLAKSKLDLQKAQNDIALNVAAAYLTVLLNKEFEAGAAVNKENSLLQVARGEKLFSAGSVAENIVNDAQTQLASDESALINARNNTRMSLLDLAQYMRLPTDQYANFDVVVDGESEQLPMPMKEAVELLVDRAMQNMPQIKSAALQVEAADKGVAIAKGSALPSLTASASYGSGYSGAAQVLTGTPDISIIPIGYVEASNDIVLAPQYSYDDSDFATKRFDDQLKDNVNKALFFTLTVPIFNGFTNTANIKRAEISLLNAQLQKEQTQQTLVNEVQRAYANSLGAYAAYEAAVVSEAAAKKSYDWVLVRMEQGVAQSAEIASARTFYDNARANLTRSKYDYIFKRRILDFYLGTPIFGQ